MKYNYHHIERKLALDAAKRLVVDSIWKIANIELASGISFPETQVIF